MIFSSQFFFLSMAVDSRNIDNDKQRNTGVMLCSTLVLVQTVIVSLTH